MFDILTELQYGELTSLRGKAPMEAPYTVAEEHILRQLNALEPKAAVISSMKYRPWPWNSGTRHFIPASVLVHSSWHSY